MARKRSIRGLLKVANAIERGEARFDQGDVMGCVLGLTYVILFPNGDSKGHGRWDDEYEGTADFISRNIEGISKDEADCIFDGNYGRVLFDPSEFESVDNWSRYGSKTPQQAIRFIRALVAHKTE